MKILWEARRRESRLSSRCPDSDSNELETIYSFWAISCSN